MQKAINDKKVERTTVWQEGASEEETYHATATGGRPVAKKSAFGVTFRVFAWRCSCHGGGEGTAAHATTPLLHAIASRPARSAYCCRSGVCVWMYGPTVNRKREGM